MSEYPEEKTLSLEVGKTFVGLKSMAYKDYLAARHLINDGFFHQSAFLMNTCLEKEFKAYLFASDIPYNTNHDTFKLYNLLKKHKPSITEEINSDFIKLLTKIYNSRYFEKLGIGYNFVIVRNKFLAEIDATFALLEGKTKIVYTPDNTPYALHKRKKYPMLIRNNYYLTNVSKEQFLNQEDWVYEFRIGSKASILEVMYQITKNDEHTRISYEALSLTDDSNSYIISHKANCKADSLIVLQGNNSLMSRPK
jgi:HEPN domain-containing protein